MFRGKGGNTGRLNSGARNLPHLQRTAGEEERGEAYLSQTPVLGAQIPESILPNVLCFGKNDLPAGACLADWSLDTRANWNHWCTRQLTRLLTI